LPFAYTGLEVVLNTYSPIQKWRDKGVRPTR